MKNKIYLFTVLFSVLLFAGCGNSKGGGGFNLFTIDQDKELGAQVMQEIESNPAEYPILDSAKYAAAYKYVYDIRNKVLNSGEVKHKNDFAWRIRIVGDDKTLNAFCTPGGYIYIYTGLIKYLESEDALAGVMGHEIAHADLRHSTQQMTKIYGVQVLLDLLAGDRQMIKEITTGLIGLKFSRSHETEADAASVRYLCGTDYYAGGGAKFFEKIAAEGGAQPPQWLSTHPSPDNRIEHFHNEALERGCSGNQEYKQRYQQLINALPR